MPTVEIELSGEIEVKVYCATCGDGLCGQSEFFITRKRGAYAIRVEACKKCCSEAIRVVCRFRYAEAEEAARKE